MRARTWFVPAAIAGLLSCLAAFLVWQYAMPEAFESSLLLNHGGVEHFRAALHLPRADVPLERYRAGFRLCVAVMWAAYGVLVAAGLAGAPLPRRRALLATVTAVALGAAFFWPPSFSCDVYGYVGYARLQVVHGLNPYATSQHALVELHDPTGPFLRWNIPSPYGPLWTSASVVVVWLLSGASLYLQVCAMKLLAAGALVAAAWAGARVAERLAPGRGDLALLAVGLNPLFVIESAGNGHNDVVMMALVVAAFAALLVSRAPVAAAWVGAAAGVKFLPLSIVPWIVLVDLRASPRPWTRRARDGITCALIAAAPLALGFWPYWRGADVLAGLRARSIAGQPASRVDVLALVVIYAGATLWLARGRADRIVGAWVAIAFGVFLLASGLWFPWYLTWAWLPLLLLPGRRAVAASTVAFAFAVLLTLWYSVART
jgi:hypothetical protein